MRHGRNPTRGNERHAPAAASRDPRHAPGEAHRIVIAKPSRYPEPVSLERVRGELDVLGAGFIFFVDERDRRGKVLYVRQDGDYGLVEPPPVLPAPS